MPTTHNHYCQYCDKMFSCTETSSEPCVLLGRTLPLGQTSRYAPRNVQGKVRSRPLEVSDISHLHQCEQAVKYREASKFAMRDNNRGCRYGCSRLPCLHGSAIRFPTVRSDGAAPRDYGKFDREFNPILWSKPVGRRLRDYMEAQAVTFAPRGSAPVVVGISPNFDSAASVRSDGQTAEPIGERASAANVERTTGNLNATATAISAAATDE